MIDNDVLAIHATQSVGFATRGVAGAEAHIAHNHIGCRDAEIPIGHTDAVAGGGLSGNGDIAMAQFQLRLQMDGATHIEYNGARACLVASPTERACAGIVQIGHMIHLSTTSASDVASISLGSGKGGCLLGLLLCPHA